MIKENIQALVSASRAPMSRDAPTTYVYDIETFPNFFLAVFKKIASDQSGEVRTFTWEQIGKLANFLKQDNLVLIGYNNFNFDDAIIKAILNGTVTSTEDVFALAGTLTDNSEDEDEDKKRTIAHLRYSASPWTCIDLFQILGGLRVAGSLKSHEVRLGMLTVQDLPFPVGTVLAEEQKKQVVQYCKGDVAATELLYIDIYADVVVRHNVNKQHPFLEGSALRRSNSSIAEQVMLSELTNKAGFNKGKFRPQSSFIFDTADRIDASIQFVDPHNQETLRRLRELGKFDAGQWKTSFSDKFVFTIGHHKTRLTQGGLHTETGALCIKSSAILEFDVSSYYPSLLRKFKTSPKGMSNKWLEILNEMTDRRLKAKDDGDKASADVQKIIINSIYGKLADKFSVNYDLALQLQVVINGQLFLLMLMERFHQSGFNVISANTDGLYIEAGERSARAQEIAKQWEVDTDFSLDCKTATIYVATAVNDYALFDEERGWFHKKGRFGLGKRTTPSVITESVLRNLSEEVPIRDTVERAGCLLDFLFSGSVKGKGVEVRHGETVIQKTNRWYKVAAGSSIEKVTLHSDGARDTQQIPYSENCALANVLHNTIIPADLDRHFYIEQAETLLRKISKAEPTTYTESKLIKQALRAKKHGFVVVPKGKLGNEKASVAATYDPAVIRYWRGQPLEQADWGTFEGFGAYTGQEFGLVGIDIDYPEIASKTGIFQYLQSGGAVVWHGDATEDDVRAGRHKGTVLFKYTGDELRTTGGRFLKDYGFEILYGKKVVQLDGFHPSRERYKYRGTLQTIPKDLLNQIAWMIDEPKNTSGDHGGTYDGDGSVATLTQFQAIANSDVEYVKGGGSLSFAQSKKQGVHLRGLCIGHHLHTNKSNGSQMIVGFWHGAISVSCFHNSCEALRRKWQTKISSHVAISKTVVVKPKNIVLTEQAQKISDSLEHAARFKLVLSATGSGKTHAIVNHVAPLLDSNSGNSDKFAIICSSKDQMRQIAERFGQALNSENINEQGIDLIESGGTLQIQKAQSRESVRDKTRVAITHYTYVSRRQFSPFYYAFLKFIDANTQVFIDEIDAFIQSQTVSLQLGSRWKQMGRDGVTKNVVLHKCGMFHGFNNCLNCVMHKYTGYQLSIDNFGNPVYKSQYEFMSGEKLQELNHIDIESRVQRKVTVGSSEVWMLKQSEDPGQLLFADGNATTEFSATFEDHLKSAYLPTVHRPFISYDGQEIDRYSLIRKFATGSSASFAIPEEERAKVKFPNRVCNVLTIALIDRRPLLWMAKAKSLTGLSATITPLQKRFLSEMVGELTEFLVEPDESRKMDKIIVVGMDKRIPVKKITEGDWNFDRMFRFRETKQMADDDFAVLKSSTIVTKMGLSNRDYIGSLEQVDAHKVLLTYSFGSLGRGIDFADYDLIDVNASTYKPISAYVTDSPETVRQLINEDRAITLTQNVGRILRRSTKSQSAVKMIVLEELESKEELKAIVDQLVKMSIQPIESWWVPEYLSVDETCKWLTQVGQDKCIPADSPKGPSALIERARKLIDGGTSKKELKQKLHWTTVQKRVDKEVLRDIETEIDRLFEIRSPAVRRKKLLSVEKVEHIRYRRKSKIVELIRAGKTDGQVRNNMKVNDAKQAWSEDEQIWFEATLKEQRALQKSYVTD